MRRPFGFMFALLALWLQALSPAVAARVAAAGSAFDPTAVVCDHFGQTNAPQPAHGQDEHDGSCCLAHHHLGAANLVAPTPTPGHIQRRTTVLVQRLGDDPAIGGSYRADRHARGPPRPL